MPFETGSLLFVLGQAFKLSIQRIISSTSIEVQRSGSTINASPFNWVQRSQSALSALPWQWQYDKFFNFNWRSSVVGVGARKMLHLYCSGSREYPKCLTFIIEVQRSGSAANASPLSCNLIGVQCSGSTPNNLPLLQWECPKCLAFIWGQCSWSTPNVSPLLQYDKCFAFDCGLVQ